MKKSCLVAVIAVLAAVAGALAAVALYLNRREKELDEYERLLFGEDDAETVEPEEAAAEDETKVLDTFRDAIRENAVVVIDGRLSVREDEASKLLADSIVPIDSYDPTRPQNGRPDPVKAAAKRLYAAQPNVSKALKNLEEAQENFPRSANPPHYTTAGINSPIEAESQT